MGRAVLAPVKRQQTGCTAEQKLPYEIMRLAHALRMNPGLFAAAYLLPGGEGCTLAASTSA